MRRIVSAVLNPVNNPKIIFFVKQIELQKLYFIFLAI